MSGHLTTGQIAAQLAQMPVEPRFAKALHDDAKSAWALVVSAGLHRVEVRPKEGAAACR